MDQIRRLNVLTFVDSNFVYPWIISANSLLKVSSVPLFVKILCNDSLLISDRELMLATFESQSIELSFEEIPTLVAFPKSTFWNEIVRAKIFAFIQNPFENEPFVSFDVDTLVIENFESDLNIFLNSGKVLGAVPEPRTYKAFSDFFQLKKPTLYFNAGILFVNTRTLNVEIFRRQCDFLITNYKNFNFNCLEQDVLNIIFRNNYHVLPPGLNMHNETHNLTNDAFIHHYIWKVKPWRLRMNSMLRFCIILIPGISPSLSRYFKYEDHFLRDLNQKLKSQVLESRNKTLISTRKFSAAVIRDWFRPRSRFKKFFVSHKFDLDTWNEYRKRFDHSGFI